jgi:hypothetical protein
VTSRVTTFFTSIAGRLMAQESVRASRVVASNGVVTQLGPSATPNAAASRAKSTDTAASVPSPKFAGELTARDTRTSR